MESEVQSEGSTVASSSSLNGRGRAAIAKAAREVVVVIVIGSFYLQGLF